MALAPLTRLGPYEVLAPLGSGGMGEVYRARDTRLERTVAIKVLAADLAGDGEFQQRLHAEARAISQLTHPHICTLHDIGEHEGTTYLVMELLEGETLAERLARGSAEQPALPLEMALQIGIQIADALAAAHQRGIVHRDLKPGNVMLTKGGSGQSSGPHAKLLDFGLAKTTPPVAASDLSRLATTSPQAVTVQGTILGTIQYMAPEQIEGGVVDARSDIFAFGSVLYELLTGRRAFEGKTQASVMAAILEREPPAVSALQPRAPALVDATVQKCLAKPPDDRWQSAADLATALRWAAGGPVQSASTRAGKDGPRARNWSSLARASAMAMLVALGLAGGLAAARLQVPAEPESPLLKFEIGAPSDGRIVFGNETGGLALSPDGTTLAFVASVNGQNGLWVRRLDDLQARLIPGTNAAGYSFWSPDGRSIGFLANGTLKRVDLAGGLPLVICRANGLRGAMWTTTGEIIFGNISSGLFRVSATGGTPMPLTTLDASRNEGFHGFPQLLSGDRFLYFVRGEPDRMGVYTATLADPTQRKFLLQTEGNALVAGSRDRTRYLMWTRGGTLIAQPLDVNAPALYGEPRPIAEKIGTAGINGGINATASDTGVFIFSASSVVSQLTWLDRSGKPTGLMGEPGDYTTFALSPDGRQVVASRERPGGSDLWLFETTRDGVVTRLTSRTIGVYPVWAPDGQQVVFGSEALLNVFRKRVSGSDEEQRLTRSPLTQLPLDWSRDGQSILMYQVSGVATGRDLFVIPGGASTETTPVPYLRTQFNEWWGRFIPQSPPRWVVYQSDESGQYQIYVDSFPTPGNRRQISTAGGQYPRWGPDGRELFYLSPDLTLMSVQISGRDTLDASPPRALFRLPAIDTGRNPYEVSRTGSGFSSGPCRQAPRRR